MESLPHMRPHPGFRLWMTTTPNAHIPASIFQSSLKLADNLPVSMRGSLKWAVDQLPSKQPHIKHTSHEDKGVSGDTTSGWMAMTVHLCCLQAILMGRQLYGNLRWAANPVQNAMQMEGGMEKVEISLDLVK